MWTALGWGLALLGIVGLAAAILKGRRIAKDEFERRNAAGVLEYASFEESLKAKQRKMLNNWLAQGATLAILAGVLMAFLIGPMLDKQARRDAIRADAEAAEAAIDAEAEPLAQQCVAGDRSACRRWCALPGTTRACIKNFGYADGPR